MHTYRYRHPELKRPWHCQAEDLERAHKRFEDAWALRIPEGLLESVDGSFFDGETKECYQPAEDDLCPKSLEGHMIFNDPRPERTEFGRPRGASPVLCVLCQGTGWSAGVTSTTITKKA